MNRNSSNISCFNINEEAVQCLSVLYDYLRKQKEFDSNTIGIPNVHFSKVEKEDLGFFPIFPLFFAEPYWGQIDLSNLRKFVAACFLYVKHIRANDDIEDEDNVSITTRTKSLAFRQLSHVLLDELFEKQSYFWKFFYKYRNQQSEALYEQNNDHILKDYYENKIMSFSDLAMKKGAIAKIAPAGICIFAKDFSRLNKFTESVDHFNVAYQFMDDFVDWKYDYDAKRPNVFVWLLGKQMRNQYPLNTFDEKIIVRVYKKAYNKLLRICKSHYVAALKSVNGLGCTEWEKLITAHLEKIER